MVRGDAMKATDPTDPRLNVLAVSALEHEIRDRPIRATAALQSIRDEFGNDGVVSAMALWIERLIADSGRAAEIGTSARLSFTNMDSGHKLQADDVDPGTAWCGRMIAARFADDVEMFLVLVNSFPTDGAFRWHARELLTYVGAHYHLVLEMRGER